LSTNYVALDLETTGFDPAVDAIIEIGAVKFNGDGVIDEFSTLVRPYKQIPERVQALTGISPDHVRDAPILEAVAADLEAFWGDCPIVGHRAATFDVLFLDAARIRHSETIYDTYDLASILLPAKSEHSLHALTQEFGVNHTVPHRALPDAQAALGVFLALRRRASELPLGILGPLAQWLSATRWPWRGFFREVLEEASAFGQSTGSPFIIPRPANFSPLEGAQRRCPVELEEAVGVLRAASQNPDAIPDYEERQEQQAMTRAVAQALNEGETLIVEAGTGTGKSLAYLIPAACYALRNSSRVVVSTATINLQEQLTRKDIPALKMLLEARQPKNDDFNELRTAQLKGRRNYLCLRRFSAAQSASTFSDDEAKLMARLLIWLTQTETGDRSELNLSEAEAALWRRFSAEESNCQAANCPFVVDGTCFLTRARRRAEAAHIVVVNHALLLSDMAVGGSLLPPYDNLIVDEAHHLEDEATRQLGFSARQEDIRELLDRCQRLGPQVRTGLRGQVGALGPGSQLLGMVAALGESAQGVQPRLSAFVACARSFLRQHSPDDIEYDNRRLIDRSMRIQPDWSDLEIAWEDLRLALSAVLDLLERLAETLITAEHNLLNYDLIAAEVNTLHQQSQLLLDGIAAAIDKDDPQSIVWLEEDRRNGGITIAWAPLYVAEILRDRLYNGKNSVIITGATLAIEPTADAFAYLRDRLGLEKPFSDRVAPVRELLLGSPFDFQRAALILVPQDLAEPTRPDYLETLARAIIDLAGASQGRALALFTSHSALRTAYQTVRPALKQAGIDVLGQGIDGAPAQLLKALRSNPHSLLLGTASFWEGIDVRGEALSLLIIARLPFSVPSEPIFAARSALFDNPFAQYALPQAVLRLKQGFGRLIRTKTDRGVAVILDRRIVSKRYGSAFLASLPPCHLREAPLRELPSLVAGWLDRPNSDGEA